MYTDWFKLKKLPFRLRPDPEFLYLADDTALAYEALRKAVASGHGIVCLLGEAGIGKTTLLHALARERQGGMSVARVQQPSLTSRELTATLAEQFGLPLQEGASQDSSARLHQFVAAETGHGRTVMILVDEAHRCSAAMLRELLNFAARPPAPLIVLAGEEELAKSLAALEAQGTAKPKVTTLRLPHLTHAQIAGYLDCRLKVAGSEGRGLFDPDTIAEILRYTGGTPQLINTLCDSAMMLAEAHSTPRVGVVEIRDAVQELNWVEFSARGGSAAAPLDTASSASSRGPTRAATPELEVERSGEFVSRMALAPGRLLVGRGEDAGLRLDSKFVSRTHCQLVTTAEQTIVEDLGSTNGILVNGYRHRLHRLLPGDKIVIGDYTLTYLDTPAATAT